MANPALPPDTGSRPISRSTGPIVFETLLGAVPVVLTAAAAVAFVRPELRALGLAFVRENGPAEMTSFLALLAAAALFALAARARRRAGHRRPWNLGIAAASSFWAAMEEVSWGQSFVRFASPAGWERFNVQNETNVHNLEPFQDLHSFALFVFGVAGFALAWWTARRAAWARAPRPVLSYLAVLTALGGLDWLTDNVPIEATFDMVIGRLVEVNELFLALGVLIWSGAIWARARSPVYAAAEEGS